MKSMNLNGLTEERCFPLLGCLGAELILVIIWYLR